ncbi:MAG: flagellar type III secretion system protein FlhB [Gemmobacter sp.]
MSADDDVEKEHAPTQKRLDDARARGEVPRSPDLATAAAYGGFLVAALTAGPASLRALGAEAAVLLDQADRLAPLMLHGGAPMVAGVMGTVGLAILPFFLLPAAAALLALIAQRAIIFSPEKLSPRLSRISPLAAIGQRLGRQGLFDFAKSAAKMVLVAVILFHFLRLHAGDVLSSVHLTPAIGTALMLQQTTGFLAVVFVLALAMGGLDWLWQRAQHIRQNRMSRQDLVDEQKGAEGDPHMKAQRRQRGQEIATNRMLLDVPRADVVIVNPTHYAVALRWSRGTGRAPVCVAKGTDAVAARIRALASEAGVPIHRDPPTARALHAAVEIGAEIRPEHYRAVAVSIRFAEAMRKRARKRSPP